MVGYLEAYSIGYAIMAAGWYRGDQAMNGSVGDRPRNAVVLEIANIFGLIGIWAGPPIGVLLFGWWSLLNLGAAFLIGAPLFSALALRPRRQFSVILAMASQIIGLCFMGWSAVDGVL